MPSEAGSVDCWATTGAAEPTVWPAAFRSSYQRTELTPVPTSTEWFTTRDSWPSAKRRYASRYINRSPSESSFWVVFGWGTQFEPLHARLNAATGTDVGPVSVVFAGVAQSTWNRHTLRELVPKEMSGFRSPADG